MINKLRSFFSSHFLIIFCVSLLLGLILPVIDRMPPEALAGYVALTIFFSSFKIHLDEIREIPVKLVLVFYLLRFVIFPTALFGAIVWFSEGVAVAMLLLALMPAGATSPAFSTILSGNVSLSLLLVVISSVLAPFLVPFLLEILTTNIIAIDIPAIFISMLLIIICPLLLHLPFRRSPVVSEWINRNNSLLIMPLIAVTIMVIIAKQRDFIFRHLGVLPVYLASTFLCYFLFYAIAWMCSYRTSLGNKISISLSSGLNNITLGIVLAQLYFTGEVIIFMVLANVAWVGALIPCRWWIASQDKES